MSQLSDMVVVEYRISGTGRLSGVDVSERNASVFTVRSGVIVRVYSAASLEEAIRAAQQEPARSGGEPPAKGTCLEMVQP